MSRTLLSFAAALAASSFLAAQITPGNLVVSRVGDGAAALTGSANARFLDEYTPAGVFVQTIALPTVVNGAQRRFTDSGSATSNGFVTQSVDGRYLLLAGYDADVGSASVTASVSTTTNRVIGRVALDGTIDTSTALTDAYSGNNFRGVASVDGTSFFTSGTGSGATPGARYVAALGDSSSTQLSTTVTNLRCINIHDGQLYVSSSSGAFVGVSAVGTGLPTTSAQTIAALPGFPILSGPSAYDFFFADANTLYVADDRLTGLGGIQKWTLAAGTWSLAYTLAPASATGCRGLTGYVESGVVTLFATTSVSSASVTTVVTVTDTGPASTFTTVVTNATNTALRDVQFVRTPAAVVNVGAGCPTNVGLPTVGVNGAPLAGNAAFAITSGNCGAGALLVFVIDGAAAVVPGVLLPDAPPCLFIHVTPTVLIAEVADGLGNGATPLPVPGRASLGGAVLSAQVIAVDPTLVGYNLPIGSSDAVQFTIGN